RASTGCLATPYSHGKGTAHRVRSPARRATIPPSQGGPCMLGDPTAAGVEPRAGRARATRRPGRVAAVGLVLATVLAGLAAVPPAAADSDQLPPSEDNPPGRTTATSSSAQGCGADGRAPPACPCLDPEPQLPVQARDPVRSPTCSEVPRLVPPGPRRSDGSLAFTSGACVSLPPGYASAKLRYPVLYLLHGGGGDEADWVSYGHIQALLDAQYAADPRRALIAVM